MYACICISCATCMAQHMPAAQRKPSAHRARGGGGGGHAKQDFGYGHFGVSAAEIIQHLCQLSACLQGRWSHQEVSWRALASGSGWTADLLQPARHAQNCPCGADQSTQMHQTGLGCFPWRHPPGAAGRDRAFPTARPVITGRSAGDRLERPHRRSPLPK